MKALNIEYGWDEEDVVTEIEKEVITFDDLDFHSHANIPTAHQARMDFPNKYGDYLRLFEFTCIGGQCWIEY